ncbi:ATP-dependent zinc metalloprotease FtsH [Candidatus Nitrospira nitrificans]|uniref:ATP-dependent zinc metalloprotease FtsH n=1 Tax=Candidatus Nitrospira nitrificans TaxID=1742973 RepID=A0A0S4L9N4_9BACT|nr:ATP-dependent zinc metalloprotease FtsH [Candidatus Nitrospira nitrificans]CUS34401.1 protease, ATP-dependent zinc-metallo [Candidatus Nitrospira nitrificans]
MNTKTQKLMLWTVLGLFLLLLLNLWNMPTRAGVEEQVIFSDFMAKLDKGDVAKVIIRGHHISGVLQDNTRLRTYSADYPDFVQALREKAVQIEVKPPEESPWYINVLMTWGPFVLFLGLWVFFMRRMQPGNQALSLVKSRARMLTDDRKKVTFSDVAGIDEAKEEVQETVEFLKDPRKFQKLGGRIPKGVLVVGPPGTGKTLLAKAIAGEAGVPFFSISGSDFVEMFVGVGASRVRDMFEQAKKQAPCIIFIDEIDAVGRSRGAGLGGGNDEREQTLNQLLVEMDGFDTTEGVILVAATNRPDVLDPALLRPGRFDRQVVVNPPDLRGRAEILKVHTKKVPVAANVDLEKIARGTPGFSGADLENLVNEAALWAARQNKTEVGVVDFDMAKDKIVMGPERKSMVLTDEEKRVTAYHEAGHALMAKLLPGTDPVHKVSIVPRGRALGVTMQLPTDDRHNYSKEFVYNTLAILMGGRVAEELVFNQITTGAGNDLERATALARQMVCEWGMSETLGPLVFGRKEESMFLGRSLGTTREVSQDMAREIDREITRLVTENYERAKRVLTEQMPSLQALAEALLEKEVLDASEIDELLVGQPSSPMVPA